MTHPHDHAHSHDYDHGHTNHGTGALGYYETMQIALAELLIQKGLFSADDMRREVEAMHSRSPARGA